MDDTLSEKIDKLIQPLIQQKGLVLFDLNVHQYQGRVRLEILVDKMLGGISIEECSSLNRLIGQELEEKNLIEPSYSLEVSSPGIDRPLKTGQDFSRVQGQKVRFFLNTPVEGKLEHCGVIALVDKDQVNVILLDKTIAIHLDKINKAKLEINF